MDSSPRWRLARALGLLAALASGGCTAELKEENNALRASVERVRDELRGSERERARLALKIQDLELDIARLISARDLGLDPNQPLWARLMTSLGVVDCELFPSQAPRTVVNFVQLAEGTRPWIDAVTGKPGQGPYYDGTVFHRVVADSFVQGGDRLGTGKGDPGYSFEDEIHPALRHEAGALSMANRGPDTNGSQFFITSTANPGLDGKHTVFGKCQPLSVIQDLVSVPLLEDAPQTPVDPPKLRRVTIHRGARPQ